MTMMHVLCGFQGGYDVNEDYDQADYDDPMTQMEYQDDDGTIYEEDYSEANEFIGKPLS